DFTCWYSLRSNVCRLAIVLCYRSPRFPSHTLVRRLLVAHTEDVSCEHSIVLKSDQAVRFTSWSFSVINEARPANDRAISVWFCCMIGIPRSMPAETDK